MRSCLKPIAPILALLAACSLFAEQATDRMSDQQFKSAGLDKLSPEELASLNETLAALYGSAPVAQVRPASSPAAAPQPAPVPTVTASPARAPVSESDMGSEQLNREPQGPKEITSRLVGQFDGWDGHTIFRLENGQVWQQRIEKTVSYKPAENPVVTVVRSFGGYRLKVEGYNQSCPVKRIK